MDDFFRAAAAGDPAAVKTMLEADPALAAAKDARGWDALTCLCFSEHLRGAEKSEDFVATAQALLDAGASANTGYFDHTHQPEPVFESALYGAAGVAHNAPLTRLLLERGADPNDDEVPYHAPEGYDNAALEAIVESGRLTADSLAVMLARKCDWHDYLGIEYLLAHGADPNRATRWGRTAVQQAVLRDNGAEILELMLEHGGDAQPAYPMAAQRGRADLLNLFDARGGKTELSGLDRVLEACARGNAELVARGGQLLAEFAGNGNTAGVRRLLALGVSVNARFSAGDGYWDVAPDSTALHVACWRARHETVGLLIGRGADVHLRDGKGRTALALAVKACVDSYWTHLRSPDSVKALLAAGASRDGIRIPCGYAEVDELLRME